MTTGSLIISCPERFQVPIERDPGSPFLVRAAPSSVLPIRVWAFLCPNPFDEKRRHGDHNRYRGHHGRTARGVRRALEPLPGFQVHGRRITIDPAEYFFRFESSTSLVADWELVEEQLLDVDETTESTVEQFALDFIKEHARSPRTSDTF